MDTEKLRNLVRNFQFYSKPSNGDSSAPCTVGDINKMISNLAKTLNGFIDELEQAENDSELHR